MGIRRALTLGYRLNLVGLLAGLSLIYVALSDKPWWILIGGSFKEPAFLAEVSPFKVSIMALGKPISISIISYLNLGMRLSLLTVAAMIILGSFVLGKRWSKSLLSLAGLIIPIAFPIFLYIGLEILKANMGILIPIVGESILNYSIPYKGRSVIVYIPVVAKITREYWLVLVIGILSLIARVMHVISPEVLLKS